MKIKLFILAITSLWLNGLNAYADTLPIVDDVVCQPVLSNKINRCESHDFEQVTEQKATYIPVELTINTTRNSYCSTPFPIFLDIYGDNDKLQSINIFQVSELAVNQANFSNMRVETNAPYAHIANFDSRCRISADVLANRVNVEQLTSNLRDLKTNTLSELSLVNNLIDKQNLIIDLASVVQVYAEVLQRAESNTLDISSLNTLLLESCDDSTPCTWSDQMQVVLDNTPDMPFRDQLLLFSLAQSLDELTSDNCSDNSCVARLIDDDTQMVLDTIIQRTPSANDAETELATYVEQRKSLDLAVVEYRAVADDYMIDWETL